MTSHPYYFSLGGLPPQSQLLTDRAVFTTAYAFVPKGTLTDITTSYLPFWNKTRLWVLARPLSGFSETFSHYIMSVDANGGSSQPETDMASQSVLFIVSGQLQLKVNEHVHDMQTGGYAYIPAGADWSAKNRAKNTCIFHWIRKRYHSIEGVDLPNAFFTSDQDVTPTEMPDTRGVWATSRFVEPDDIRHDMHVNIVTFKPGGVIPFAETHVMEHGIYVLQGKAVYHLNQNWIEVEAGDFMWLRAFCPQACYAGGPEPFRYLLYKDVNRHAKLEL